MVVGELPAAVVVVGVKLDSKSKELLTWALMKVAQPGDLVLALHVLDSHSEFGGSTTGSLLSLVNTFDSFLSAYHGFCNLKQVELKLKLCRGSSVRNILVREVKENSATKLVVGACDAHHAIRSSASVAKYCARKLPSSVSVFAVRNGKVRFQRDCLTTQVSSHDKMNHENPVCTQAFHDKHFKSCDHCVSSSTDACRTQVLEELSKDAVEKVTLALVPCQRSESDVSGASSSDERSESKHGWSFLRLILQPKRHRPEKSHLKKTHGGRWILKQPKRNSSFTVHPGKGRNISCLDDHPPELEGDNKEIVPVGPTAEWSPMSPYHGSGDLPEELRGLHEKYSSSCRLFTHEELSLATCNFKPENLVGQGGSSYVYRGSLPDGKELAVKILKPSKNVLEEFLVEVQIITDLHHQNIVSLFGFCFEENNLLLVYDFLSRGSLEENLHGNKKDHVSFDWRKRYKVAVGVAEALDYLHNGCDQLVIHRDVKSSNILLSDAFEPQLSDFGFASQVSKTSSIITCSDVTGTFGYLAPEYFVYGKVSDKVDVFAFGVVLLELLSGRRAISSENTKGQESLVMWAKPILEGGKFSELIDSKVGGEHDATEVERMILAANLCLRRSPRHRPPISLILNLLRGDDVITNWARLQTSSSLVHATDEEPLPTNIQNYLNLALLDLEDAALSFSSNEQGVSSEDYLQGRWSRTPSFD